MFAPFLNRFQIGMSIHKFETLEIRQLGKMPNRVFVNDAAVSNLNIGD
jgi:hypothetical protein